MGGRVVKHGTLLSRWLTVSLIVMMVTSAVVVMTSAAFFQDRLLASHLLRAQAVAGSMKVQLERLLALGIAIDEIQGFEQQCRDVLANNASVSAAMVIGRDGRILFHSDPAQIGASMRDEGLWKKLSDGFVQGGEGDRYFGADTVSDITLSEVLATTVVVFPESVISGEINQLLMVSMGVALVLVGLGALILRILFQRVVSRPVVHMLKSIETLRTTDNAQGQRLQRANLLEIDRVVEGFNRLLDRVDLHEIELLKAKDQAEAANAAKSAFLANMSHELRTPLHAIIGMTNIAIRKGADPKGRNYLDKSLLAAKRLMGIINDMLDIASIESQRLKIETKAFSVPALVSEQVELIVPMIGEKPLSVTVSLDDAVRSSTLCADPLRLGQVLLNLLSNAVKFSDRGIVQVVGSLEQDNPRAPRLRIEVRDSGIGIPESKLGSIFDSFEQVDTSSTRKYGGTGLGLAICAKLVELMGGEIGCKSVEGVGSAFWFAVPVQLAQISDVDQAPVCEATSSDVPGNMGARCDDPVLLVEDDEDNQLVALEYLNELELPCVVAGDGDAAIRLCGERRFSLILMDLQLPGMDGMETARRIRALPAFSAVPIIAMSANAFESDREATRAAGMNDFLAKPVEPDAFRLKLAQWLETRKDCLEST